MFVPDTCNASLCEDNSSETSDNISGNLLQGNRSLGLRSLGPKRGRYCYCQVHLLPVVRYQGCYNALCSHRCDPCLDHLHSSVHFMCHIRYVLHCTTPVCMCSGVEFMVYVSFGPERMIIHESSKIHCGDCSCCVTVLNFSDPLRDPSFRSKAYVAGVLIVSTMIRMAFGIGDSWRYVVPPVVP